MGVYRTAGLDRTSTVLTALLVAAPCVSLIVGSVYGGEVRYASLTITIALSLICVGSYAMAPSGYVVLQDRLVIKRHLWPSASIKLSGIKGCYSLPELRNTKLIRLFGNGGAFGWYGLYASDKLGAVRMYATNLAAAVVLEDSVKYVVSPEQEQAFVAAVKQHAGLDT